MNKRVIIQRGLPGSGKTETTSLIKKMFQLPVIVCSADDFHIMVDGVYQFKPENIQKAHSVCFLKFLAECQSQKDGIVVVDNTNVRLEEIVPYYRVAFELGLKPLVIEHLITPALSEEENTHRVPKATIAKMFAAWDGLPENYRKISFLWTANIREPIEQSRRLNVICRAMKEE